MKKNLTLQEIEEQELINKINSVVFELDLKRGNGVTLEKNQYIGECQRELEEELSKLKTKKSRIMDGTMNRAWQRRCPMN